MTATPDSGMIAGAYHFSCGVLHDGYQMGTLPPSSSPVNGTVYGMYHLDSLVSFSPGAPTYETAQERAGQHLGVQRDLGPSAYGTSNIVLSRYDELLFALLRGAAVDVSTMSNWSMLPRNINASDPPSMVLLMSMGFTSKTQGKRFLNLLYHSATLRAPEPGATQNGGTNPNPLQLDIIPSPAERTGLGLLHEDLDMEVVENNDTSMTIITSKPLYITTYVDDHTATSFDLPYLPLFSDATGAADNLVVKDGTQSTVGSVSTSTGAVGVTPALAGIKWMLTTPTDFVPS